MQSIFCELGNFRLALKNTYMIFRIIVKPVEEKEMPIYEYLCTACGELFSKLQKMGVAEGEVACPTCGSQEVKRQISGCSIGGGGTSAPACSIGGG